MRQKKAAKQEKRVRVNLTSAEFVLLDTLVKKAGTTHSSFLRQLLISHTSQTSSTPVELCFDQILARFTKLERIQRTLVLNSAYARGYAVAAMRSAPSDTRKVIEQEMATTANEQKAFFFGLYPEQKE
jgi:hypothetical protein